MFMQNFNKFLEWILIHVYLYKVVGLIHGKMQDFGANRDFFSKFWLLSFLLTITCSVLWPHKISEFQKARESKNTKYKVPFGLLRQFLSPNK